MTTPAPDWPGLWAAGESFPTFLARAVALRPLWEGHAASSRLADEATAPFRALPRGVRLLALNADWCLDSASTIPVLAQLAEAVPRVELRLLERDRYPEVMSRYLTNGGRSIPLVIVLDDTWRELGHWGPRPAPLQAWVRANLAGTTPEERRKEQRRWYARDRGETTLRELLAVVTSAADQKAQPVPIEKR